MPLGRNDEMPQRLAEIYRTIARFLDDPSERVLVHYEEFGDRLIGVFAGYLIYTGLVPEGPHAIQVLEKQTGRQMGTIGREIVAATLSDQLLRQRTE